MPKEMITITILHFIVRRTSGSLGFSSITAQIRMRRTATINRTPLHEAVKSAGDAPNSLTCCSTGARNRIHRISKGGLRLPLHLASEAGYPEGARLLLRRNCDVHA